MARQIRTFRVLRDVVTGKPLQYEMPDNPEFQKHLEVVRQKARHSGSRFRKVFGRA